MAERKEELKSFLMRVKEESEKNCHKTTFKKLRSRICSHNFMANRRGKKVETMTEFLFLGFKITVDRDCSHEIERHLLLRSKTMTNPKSILKKEITLPGKILIVKAIIFPVVICGLDSWTIKKAES